jgi:hypothetical protein
MVASPQSANHSWGIRRPSRRIQRLAVYSIDQLNTIFGDRVSGRHARPELSLEEVEGLRIDVSSPSIPQTSLTLIAIVSAMIPFPA